MFNNIPTTNTALAQYIGSVLDPSVSIVSANCNTQLGLQVPASEGSSYLGMTLLNGETVTLSLLGQIPPTSYLNIRTLSTCTALEGVCQACLATAGLSGNIGSSIRIPTNSSNRYTYVLTLVDSYWGSLFTAAPLNINYQLPVRRQLYYPNLQPSLHQTFIPQLGFNNQTEEAVKTISDPFDQFLVIAATYCLGGIL